MGWEASSGWIPLTLGCVCVCNVMQMCFFFSVASAKVNEGESKLPNSVGILFL